MGLSEILSVGPIDHRAEANLSSNILANRVFASHYSDGGIICCPATWRKTRYSNLINSAPNLGICGPGSDAHSEYKHTLAGLDQVFRSSCFIGRMIPATASALSYPRYFAISHR